MKDAALADIEDEDMRTHPNGERFSKLRERRRRIAALALLGCAAACSDSTVIGGLCPADCGTDSADAGQDCLDGSCPGGNGPSRCVAGPHPLARRPGALYLVVDDSSTLVPHWPAIRDALDGFFADGASASLDLGLQLLGNACDPAQYEPIVPIGPVSNAVTSLRSAIPTLPMKSSSTVPGLKGALAHARIWAAAHPDSTISVLLLSDALPAECDTDASDYTTLLTGAAREGLTGTPSVQTFVVGLGVLPAIQELARAGGTQATVIGQEVTSREILNALRSVRDGAPSCAFTLPDGVPASAAGAMLSFDGQRFSLRDRASACGGLRDAFYLSNVASRPVVVACPETCSVLPASGELSLWTGCGAGASTAP